MYVSVFNGGGGRGSGKNQEAEVVFLSGPWQIWGEGAFPGSVTHFLPQPEFSLHSPYCPQGGKSRGREPPHPIPYEQHSHPLLTPRKGALGCR